MRAAVRSAWSGLIARRSGPDRDVVIMTRGQLTNTITCCRTAAESGDSKLYITT